MSKQMQEEGALRHKSNKKKTEDAKKMKISGVLQTVVFAHRAPEAKNAQAPSGKQNFDGRPKPKKEKPNGPKGDKCQKRYPKGRHLRG